MVSFKPDGQRINKVPTILYNRMIHPLLGFPIKGVIWYQGESNANNMEQATEYRRLFSTLITSWRSEWRGSGSFPFLWVQLPNYGAVDSIPPATSTWATVRESQAAALSLPNTGQVVAIDLGGAAELHPRNKQGVGARFALVARSVAYGQRVVSSGPTYRRHSVRNGRVTIELGNLGGGLVSRAGDAPLTGFAIAGEDQQFVWAGREVGGEPHRGVERSCSTAGRGSVSVDEQPRCACTLQSRGATSSAVQDGRLVARSEQRDKRNSRTGFPGWTG
jgi:sialate O-acetylesterase